MHTFSNTAELEKPIDSMHSPKCLVVDDDMSVFNIARSLDFRVQPCTHYELMSNVGQQHFQGLHDRKFNFLWISLPQTIIIARLLRLRPRNRYNSGIILMYIEFKPGWILPARQVLTSACSDNPEKLGCPTKIRLTLLAQSYTF